MALHASSSSFVFPYKILLAISLLLLFSVGYGTDWEAQSSQICYPSLFWSFFWRKELLSKVEMNLELRPFWICRVLDLWKADPEMNSKDRMNMEERMKMGWKSKELWVDSTWIRSSAPYFQGKEAVIFQRASKFVPMIEEVVARKRCHKDFSFHRRRCLKVFVQGLLWV